MEYNYWTYITAKESEKDTPEQIAFNLIAKFGYKSIDFAKLMKRLEKDSPNAILGVKVTYNSEGLKEHEPSEEQRQQLSALSKIHKRLMDKMKESTDGMEAVNYAILINHVTAMMDEIENEKDTQE